MEKANPGIQGCSEGDISPFTVFRSRNPWSVPSHFALVAGGASFPRFGIWALTFTLKGPYGNLMVKPNTSIPFLTGGSQVSLSILGSFIHPFPFPLRRQCPWCRRFASGRLQPFDPVHLASLALGSGNPFDGGGEKKAFGVDSDGPRVVFVW